MGTQDRRAVATEKRTNFLNNISSSCKQVDGGEEEELEEVEEVEEEPNDEEDESEHEELCANAISSMKEAIMAVENVYSYLEQKGHTSLANDSISYLVTLLLLIAMHLVPLSILHYKSISLRTDVYMYCCCSTIIMML